MVAGTSASQHLAATLSALVAGSAGGDASWLAQGKLPPTPGRSIPQAQWETGASMATEQHQEHRRVAGRNRSGAASTFLTAAGPADLADVRSLPTGGSIQSASSSSRERHLAASSFFNLRVEDGEPGGPLPKHAYGRCIVGGEGSPPEFFVGDFPVNAKSLAVVAEDKDAPFGPQSIWVKLLPLNEDSLFVTSSKEGRTLLPYHGPMIDPNDEYVHRIVFRAYALEEEAHNQLQYENDPLQAKKLLDNMYATGPPSMEGRGKNFHELMFLAVAKQRKASAGPDCAQPVDSPSPRAQRPKPPLPRIREHTKKLYEEPSPNGPTDLLAAMNTGNPFFNAMYLH